MVPRRNGMAHSAQVNGGQIQSSVRKRRNQTERYELQQKRATALGITIMALQILDWQALLAGHEEWKRRARAQPRNELSSSQYNWRRW
jgi:hypothetical protein